MPTPVTNRVHNCGMIWTVWALMIVAHGAYARWVRTMSRHAAFAAIADGLLVVIAIVTIAQIQDLRVAELLRIGVFFVAFGVAGRQFMNAVLRQQKLS
jgi:2-methylisocitrate lyase-like PEP mutase family enzyme